MKTVVLLSMIVTRIHVRTMLPVSMTPTLAHTVAHAWMDSLDQTVKWTLTCACIQRLLLYEKHSQVVQATKPTVVYTLTRDYLDNFFIRLSCLHSSQNHDSICSSIWHCASSVFRAITNRISICVKLMHDRLGGACGIYTPSGGGVDLKMAVFVVFIYTLLLLLLLLLLLQGICFVQQLYVCMSCMFNARTACHAWATRTEI